MDTRRYWPFPIPVAWDTDVTRRQVAFFEKANRQGFKSFDHGSMLGAVAANGREAELIPRSGIDGGLRRFWEVALKHDSIMHETFYVDGFENATEVVLLWLQGEDSSQIKSSKQGCIVQRPGTRSEVAAVY